MLFPDKNKFKIEYSDEIMDLIIRLLDKDRATRLGSMVALKRYYRIHCLKIMTTTKSSTKLWNHLSSLMLSRVVL